MIETEKQVRAIFATCAGDRCKAFDLKELYCAILGISRLVIIRDTLDLAKAGHGELDAASTIVCGADVFDCDK
jgi:hypothetical protein